MLQNTLKKLRYVGSFYQKKLIHLNLQLLYSCNFQCRICDFWKDPYPGYPALSVDQVKIIAQKLKSVAPLVISIGGGEPLLHKGLVEITEILSKDHFPVMICNGWFVTPEIARNLFKAGMHEVSISVDYADPAKHDAQRGKKGAFEKAISALRILHENRVNPEQRVHMISVIMDDNLDQIEPLIKIAKDMGITYLITFYSNGRGVKDSKDFNTDVGKYLLSLKDKYKEFVSLPGYVEQFTEAYNNPNGITPCFAGKNLFNIDSQGNVTRCIDRLDDVAGNIFTDDFNAIKENLFKQFQTANCGVCWTSCRGSIESLMYGNRRWENYKAYYQMTKKVPLLN
jgi:MoaA/NifB/PqqE/SkfB family radical SAM enzyme